MKRSFNNVIYGEDLKNRLIASFDELDEILTAHAGPFARNCVIGSKWRQQNDVDEFTKDGIKILRHLIVSEDPVARFAARMVRFVGIAVDKTCHDGTTTSMLLFCRMAKISLAAMDSDIRSIEAYEHMAKITRVIETCLGYLTDLKITDEEIHTLTKEAGLDVGIEQVRAAIAYHMAMISSKGDHDLSTKISTMIRATPKKIHGMYSESPMAIETEEKYILEHQDYDISLKANLGNFEDLNHLNSTQYLSEDAVVFMTGNDIVTHSRATSFLISFISDNPRFKVDLEGSFGTTQGWRELCEGKRNLIIVSPTLSDHNLIAEINIFNREHPKCKISYFNFNVNHRVRATLEKAMHYMHGVPIFEDVESSGAYQCLLGLGDKPIKVHSIGQTVTFSNIYEKTGNVFHPYYDDPTLFPEYNLFIKDTEEIIKFATENVTNPSLDPYEVADMVSLYRASTCQEIYNIRIGGSKHDQYANSTVFEDAIGSALSAVNDGVVLGGYAQLFRLLSSFEVGSIERDVCEILQGLVCDTLRLTTDSGLGEKIVGSIESKWSYPVMDSYRTVDGSYSVLLNTLNVESIIDFMAMEKNTPFLLQAYTGYREQLNRMNDMLPRLAGSAHLIDMRLNENEDVV